MWLFNVATLEDNLHMSHARKLRLASEYSKVEIMQVYFLT